MRGENSGDEYLFVKSSYFEFECDENIKWTLDGEYGGTERVNEVFNRKQAVTFHVDPACREQAEENADSGFAIVKPLPDDVQPFGIEKQTDDDAENSFQPEEPDPDSLES